MSNLGPSHPYGDLEKAAESPFEAGTENLFVVEPVYDPRFPRFETIDLAYYDRVGILGRFSMHDGQATFFVRRPGSVIELDAEEIERGVNQLESYGNVVDQLRADHIAKKVSGVKLEVDKPESVELLGGLVFFYNDGHEVFNNCLVFRKDSGLLRSEIGDEILNGETGGVDDAMQAADEKGIVRASEPPLLSLGKGIVRSLIWDDPISSTG